MASCINRNQVAKPLSEWPHILVRLRSELDMVKKNAFSSFATEHHLQPCLAQSISVVYLIETLELDIYAIQYSINKLSASSGYSVLLAQIEYYKNKISFHEKIVSSVLPDEEINQLFTDHNLHVLRTKLAETENALLCTGQSLICVDISDYSKSIILSQ